MLQRIDGRDRVGANARLGIDAGSTHFPFCLSKLWRSTILIPCEVPVFCLAPDLQERFGRPSRMIRAAEQLEDEATYTHLSAFLRSGGTLEVGEDLFTEAFARLRKGNKTFSVSCRYRDLAAVWKEMDSQAKRYLENGS